MLFIVSKDISLNALKKLENYGDVFLFGTKNITYKAIQNHPDIFLFFYNNSIISAPNTPQNITNNLISKGFKVITGETPVESNYPYTAMYNAVLTNRYLIHNLSHTDSSIKEISSIVKSLNVNQGYCRCNLLALPNNTFITSDKGILNVLQNEGLKVLYINPEKIILKGFSNGFFGGCCGVSKKYFFINGSIKHFKENTDIEQSVSDAHLELVELSNETPEDIGSILILDTVN